MISRGLCDAARRGALLSVLLCAAFSACEPVYVKSFWPPTLGTTPPESTATQHEAQSAEKPPARASSANLPAKPTGEGDAKDLSEKSGAPAPPASPAKEQAKAPLLTLAPTGSPAEDARAQQQAQVAVDRAVRQLALVDRSKLNGQHATDYDLVSGFIRGAQEAIRESDFVRAQGLAEKAALLAAQLAAYGATGP